MWSETGWMGTPQWEGKQKEDCEMASEAATVSNHVENHPKKALDGAQPEALKA